MYTCIINTHFVTFILLDPALLNTNENNYNVVKER